MSLWRSTTLALWALVAVVASGCSTTSMPARVARLATGQVRPDRTASFDRLVAIGRTFESQGNYTKARRMYGLVLSREPNNRSAVDGMQRIASLSSTNQEPARGAMPSPVPEAASSLPKTMIADSEVRTPVSTGSQTATTQARPQVVMAASAASAPAWTPPVTQVAATAVASPEPVDEGWTLPVVAPSPVYQPVVPADPGRVSLGAADLQGCPANEFELPLPETAQTPAAGDLLEACLQEPGRHVDSLAAHLDSADPETRSLAAFLLGEAGEDAAAVLPRLQHRLQVEPTSAVRLTVATAIVKHTLEDADARSALLAGLTSPNPSLRSQSALGLRAFGVTGDKDVIAALQHAVADSDSNVAAMAALSLGDFGQTARSALPALEAARDNADAVLQEALDAAIGRIRS